VDPYTFTAANRYGTLIAMSDTATEPVPIDWTADGSKPQREGERCSGCGQVLMLTRPGRSYCAYCDVAAGRDPFATDQAEPPAN